MITEILTALGIVSVPTGAGVSGWLALRDRITKLESQQPSTAMESGLNHEIVLVKLDAISEKIDLRCDALEKRVDRIERKVLNGEYSYHGEKHK